MPQACKICTHAKHSEINDVLMRGEESLSALARRFGVSQDSLSRHRANHLVKAAVPFPEPQDVKRDGDLVEQVQDLQRKTLEILKQAEQVGNQRTMLLAVEQSRRNLELQAKLLGELKSGKTVNILVLPEWLELKGKLMRTLQRYPAALEAVYEAIEG